MAVQAFVKRGSFIGEMLKWTGRRWIGTVLDEIGGWQWLDTGHRGTEFGLFRGERGRLMRRLGLFSREIPVRRQGFRPQLFALTGIFFAG